MRYGTNWLTANQLYRWVAANTTMPRAEMAAYAHGMRAASVAPVSQ